MEYPGTFLVEVNNLIDQYEGEWSDDPKDPGGKTRWGIASAAHPGLDLDTLTRDGAIAIYYEEYWVAPGCEKILVVGAGLAALLFDACVNHGTYLGPRYLQQAIAAAVPIKVDGKIGPATISAAMKIPIRSILAEFAARRMQCYGNQPLFKQDGLGWSRRLISVYSRALLVS